MDERFVKKLYCEYGVDRGLSEIVMRQRDVFWLSEVQKSTNGGKDRLQMRGNE